MKKIVFLLWACLLFGCNSDQLDFDEVGLPPIESLVAFPLGETEYFMKDLITKQTGDSLDLVEDDTGLYRLFYYDTLNYSNPGDFITISDISGNGTVTAPNVTAGVADEVRAINGTFNFTYDADNGEVLDSIFYETGDIMVDFTSNIPYEVDYTLAIASTREITTDQPISFMGNLPGPGSDSQMQSLAGYRTDLINGNNTFTVVLVVEVQLPAGMSLNDTQEASFTVTYANQTFNLIYGKLGQDEIQIANQSIELDFFTQTDREGITFGNPKLTFDFRNSYGVPMEIDFSGITAQNEESGADVSLTGRIVRNTPPVIAGSDVFSPAPNVPGDFAQSIVEIDRTNSNLIQLMGTSPDRLLFDVKGNTNPADNTTLNYLQPTSEINAYVTLELPFELQLDSLKESGFYTIGEGINLDNVDSAFVRVFTLNELPFQGTLNLEIQAEDGTVLYTIVDRLVIQSPFININGEVTDPSGNTEDIPLPPEGVEAMKEAARLQLTLSLSTPQSQTSREIYVKILSTYALQLRVGLGGKLNLDI